MAKQDKFLKGRAHKSNERVKVKTSYLSLRPPKVLNYARKTKAFIDIIVLIDATPKLGAFKV